MDRLCDVGDLVGKLRDLRREDLADVVIRRKLAPPDRLFQLLDQFASDGREEGLRMLNARTVIMPRPSPDEAICDFCNSPAPGWGYPARDFEIDLNGSGGRVLTIKSAGAWAGCEKCSGLIENGDFDGLAQHAHNLTKLSVSDIRTRQEQFRAHRDGPRFRLT